MNTFGRLFRISIFGESHSNGVGILIDGVPPGIYLTKDCFKKDLNRRKSGSLGNTSRIEKDEIIIESGVFNNYTTGAPIMLRSLNENVNSKDYSNIINTPRPSHADLVANIKYQGYNDYRGGGHFSGRLTLGIVAAGVIAKKVKLFRQTTFIRSLKGDKNHENHEAILKEAINNNDSIGGVITSVVENLPIGLGEPYFDSVESLISHLLFSIGGVKGVNFGIGFEGEKLYGSEFNDLIINEYGKTKTNNNGGINGGITNGNDLVVNVFVKPTPSIKKPQETFDFKEGKIKSLTIEGRHDSAIILRALVVVEAVISIVLTDLYMINKSIIKSSK